MYLTKLETLKLLDHFENTSTCRKRKVAAIILQDHHLRDSFILNRLDLIANGANKSIVPYRETTCDICLQGYKGAQCPAIHAEIDCLINTPFETTYNSNMFVSYSPCPECCKAIRAAGIRRLFIKEPRLSKPSKIDCKNYKVSNYDELAEALLPGVQYYRLWEMQDEEEIV